MSKLDKMNKEELERVFLSKNSDIDYGWKKLTRTETCSNIHEVALQLAAQKDKELEEMSEDIEKSHHPPSRRAKKSRIGSLDETKEHSGRERTHYSGTNKQRLKTESDREDTKEEKEDINNLLKNINIVNKLNEFSRRYPQGSG